MKLFFNVLVLIVVLLVSSAVSQNGTQWSTPTIINNVEERVQNYLNNGSPVRNLNGELVNGSVRGNIEVSDYEKKLPGQVYGVSIFYNFKEGIPHGEFNHIYYHNTNSHILKKGTYKNGKLNGQYELFHVNGQLEGIGNYSEGKEVGEFFEYHSNGQIRSKLLYINGLLKDGEVILYRSDGSVQIKGVIIKEKWNGLYEEFYWNGNISLRGNMINDKLNGLYEEFYENGTISKKGSMINSYLNGIVESYFLNGRLKSKTTYNIGQKHGSFETYFENGQLESKGSYRNEILHGPFESYHENGRRNQRGDYDNGAFTKRWF